MRVATIRSLLVGFLVLLLSATCAGNRVEDDSGESADVLFGGEGSDAPDTDPPTWAERSFLGASNIGSRQVQLNWGETTDGQVAARDNVAVTAYTVYQDGRALGVVDGNTLVFVPSPDELEPNTVYTFQVQAGDAAGNWSTDGPSATVKTE